MHLGDGRARYGLAELGKQLLDRMTQFRHHDSLRFINGKWWKFVLEHLKFAGQFPADHVGSRRHELAELDICRSQCGQGPRQGRPRGIPAVSQPQERQR